MVLKVNDKVTMGPELLRANPSYAGLVGVVYAELDGYFNVEWPSRAGGPMDHTSVAHGRDLLPVDGPLVAITCPECGGIGPFRYLEKIWCWRTVAGVHKGKVYVPGLYQSGEGYDDGEEATFECHAEREGGRACLHTWAVPRAVEAQIEWDDLPRTAEPVGK